MNLNHMVSVLVSLSLLLSLDAPAVQAHSPSLPANQAEDQGWIAYLGKDNNIWVVHPDGSGTKQITSDKLSEYRHGPPKWSPDGQMLAFTVNKSGDSSDQGDVLIYSLASETILRTITATGANFDWLTANRLVYDKPVTFTNDTRGCPTKLASYDGLYVMDIFTGVEEAFLPAAAGRPLLMPQVSPSGSSVILRFDQNQKMYGSGPYYVSELAEGSRTHALEGSWATCDWSPDGKTIACDNYDNTKCDLGSGGACPVILYSASGAKLSTLGVSQGLYDLHPRWSPDGQSIAVTASDGFSFADGPCAGGSGPYPGGENVFIDLISTADPNKRSRLTSGALQDWSPDGKYLLISREAFLYVADSQTREVGPAIAQGAGYYFEQFAAWQPLPILSSGKWIAYKGADKAVYAIHPDGSGKRQIYQPNKDEPTNIVSLKWSASGRYLAIDTQPLPGIPELWVWDSQTDKLNSIRSASTLSLFFTFAWSPVEDVFVFQEVVGEQKFENPAYITNYIYSLSLVDPATLTRQGLIDQFKGNYAWMPDGAGIAFAPMWVADTSQCKLKAGLPLKLSYTEYKGIDRIDIHTRAVTTLIPAKEKPLIIRGVSAGSEALTFDEEATGCFENDVLGGIKPDLLALAGQPEAWREMPGECLWSPRGSKMYCFDSFKMDKNGVFDRRGSFIAKAQLPQSCLDGYPTGWSPDERSIAFSCGEEDNTTLIIDASSGKPVQEFPRWVKAWAPDSSQIVFSDQDDTGERLVITKIGRDDFLLLDQTSEVSKFGTIFGPVAWQPGLEQSEGQPAVLSAEAWQKWLSRKKNAIEKIEKPTYTILLDQPNLGNEPSLPIINEKKAQDLLSGLPDYPAGLKPEEIEAFTRLVLQEETIARAQENYAKNSDDMGEWLADIAKIGLYSVQLFPGNEIGLHWLQSYIEDTGHLAIHTTTTPKNRDKQKQLFDLAVVISFNRSNLEGYAMDLGPEAVIRLAVARANHQVFKNAVQPTIDQGVNSVPAQADPYWKTDGTLKDAEGTTGYLSKTSKDFSATFHNNYEQSNAGLDIAKISNELTDLALRSKVGFILKYAVVAKFVTITEILLLKWWMLSFNIQPALECSLQMAQAAGQQSFIPDIQSLPDCKVPGQTSTALTSQVFPSTSYVDAAAWEEFKTAYATILAEYSTQVEKIEDKLANNQMLIDDERRQLDAVLNRLEPVLDRGSTLITPPPGQTWDNQTLEVFQAMMQIKTRTALLLLAVDIPREELREADTQAAIAESFAGLNTSIDQNQAAIDKAVFEGDPAGIGLVQPLSDPLAASPGTTVEIPFKLVNIGSGPLETGHLLARVVGSEAEVNLETPALESGQEILSSVKITAPQALPALVVLDYTAHEQTATQRVLIVEEAQAQANQTKEKGSGFPYLLTGGVLVLVGGVVIIAAGIFLLARRKKRGQQQS